MTVKDERTYAVVVGRGEIPFDMLRYDCCFPDSSDDASTMGNSSRCPDRPRVMIIAKYRKMGNFTPDRWKSFGWSCVTFSDRYAAKAHMEMVQKSF